MARVASCIVRLPEQVRAPFDVYLNGVPQQEGEDYRVGEGVLHFFRPLAQEGRVGLWRWLIGAFGVGTYRQNDSVDVRFQRGGETKLAAGLTIEVPPPTPTPESRPGPG